MFTHLQYSMHEVFQAHKNIYIFLLPKYFL